MIVRQSYEIIKIPLLSLMKIHILIVSRLRNGLTWLLLFYHYRPVIRGVGLVTEDISGRPLGDFYIVGLDRGNKIICRIIF